jgi:DNA repair protein RecO (recombination protein O)
VHLTCEAVVCAVRPHGEHGAIVRLLTQPAGLMAGYVRGGRSRNLRPVLMPGNKVKAEFKARHADQLASLAVELVDSRAALLDDPMATAGMEWVTALSAAILPEEQPYEAIFEALEGTLCAMMAAPSARRWANAIVLFEGVVMHALGYGGRAPERAEDWPAIFAELNGNAARLSRHLLTDRQRDLLDVRARMVERFKRAVA